MSSSTTTTLLGFSIALATFLFLCPLQLSGASRTLLTSKNPSDILVQQTFPIPEKASANANSRNAVLPNLPNPVVSDFYKPAFPFPTWPFFPKFSPYPFVPAMPSFTPAPPNPPSYQLVPAKPSVTPAQPAATPAQPSVTPVPSNYVLPSYVPPYYVPPSYAPPNYVPPGYENAGDMMPSTPTNGDGNP